MSNRVSPEPTRYMSDDEAMLGTQRRQQQQPQEQPQQPDKFFTQSESNEYGTGKEEREDADNTGKKKRKEKQLPHDEDDLQQEEQDGGREGGEDDKERQYLRVVRPGETPTPDGQSGEPELAVAARADTPPPPPPQSGDQAYRRRLPPLTADPSRPHPTNTVDSGGIGAGSKMSNSRPTSANQAKTEVIGAGNTPQDNGCCAIILTALSYLLVLIFFPFSLCATIKVVQEYERAVIFRLGRLLPGGAKGPGIFFVMPCIEEYSKVDLRTVSFDVPPQEVLTRDSVTVSVDAVVYYRISSPTVSVANVENAANSTQLLAQTTLRNVLGTQNLAEILSNREHISEQMQNVLDDATDKWGIKVERVEIKDVRLPTQLQRAMAAEAEAARDARAKVIAAEGEQKASVALKEAADIIAVSPAALQLRYLQTLNSISAEKNSTIIFPLPIDLVSTFMKK